MPEPRPQTNGNGTTTAPPPTLPSKTPRERFLDSSDIRMKAALTAIDLIGSFGRNRVNYDYTDDEAEGIFDRLYHAIEDMRRDLRRPRSGREERKVARSWR